MRSEIYRVKGIVQVTNSKKPHLVQAVREIYDITEAPHGAISDAGLVQSRVVLIGRILDQLALQMRFEQCIEAENPQG